MRVSQFTAPPLDDTDWPSRHDEQLFGLVFVPEFLRGLPGRLSMRFCYRVSSRFKGSSWSWLSRTTSSTK